jgi:MYXO-CTERM domain-containing protein
MRHRLFALLPLLGLLIALPARADLLRAIDARHAAGAIDDETRHFYRVAALKDRDLLPAELRDLPLVAERRYDPTRITVEAMQWIILNQAAGGRLQRLMSPPTDLANVLDSTTLPIRVSYKNQTPLVQAQTLLAAAEQAWTVMTQDYGFYVPAIEPGFERFRIYIDDSGAGAAAYTAPYAEDPATARTDCYSYIVYSPMNPLDASLTTIGHELNHAMQAAMDCLEVWPYWEATSTYMETQLDPSGWEYAYWTMEVFQNYPWRALDYSAYGNTDGYEYGGALFNVYLTSTYAPAAGPIFVRQVWEACIQNDPYNSKDYFEGVAETVHAAGGPSDLESVFADFSEARYFVGVDSDNAHIANARSFAQCEVTRAATFGTTSLPVTAGKPTADKRPSPYGSNHVVLNLGGSYAYRLRVGFDGADETRWAVRVLLVGNGATESLPIELDPDTQSGQIEVDPAGRSKVVLVVANLALPGYSPNDQAWDPSDYTFRFEPIAPAPTLTALVPAEVEQGALGVAMTLQGKGFLNGPEFAVAFDDPTLFVASVTSVADTEVKFVLSVPPGETQVGRKTIIVTNAGGQQAEGPDLLNVIAPRQDAGTPDDGGGGGGCGCKTAASSPSARLALLLLLVLPLRRRRHN